MSRDTEQNNAHMRKELESLSYRFESKSKATIDDKLEFLVSAMQMLIALELGNDYEGEEYKCNNQYLHCDICGRQNDHEEIEYSNE